MYSERLEKAFESAGIGLGERFRLTSEGKVMEGMLMPRPDSGNPDIIIIKFDNGYNAGIKFTRETKLEKLEAAKAAAKQNSPSVHSRKFNHSLGKVELIYTGGTISSKIDYKTGGVYMLTKPEELLETVPEIAGIANLSLTNLMSIASEDMSYLEWQK